MAKTKPMQIGKNKGGKKPYNVEELLSIAACKP
jgi:hypothetical protein